MEIRTQSQAGPLVPPLAEIPAKLSQQVDAMKQQWLEQWHRDPASFAQLELEIHDHFRGLADQMTASLLAEGQPLDSGVWTEIEYLNKHEPHLRSDWFGSRGRPLGRGAVEERAPAGDQPAG